MNTLNQTLLITRDDHIDWELTNEALRQERHTLLKVYGRQALVGLSTTLWKSLKVVDNVIDEWIKSL